MRPIIFLTAVLLVSHANATTSSLTSALGNFCLDVPGSSKTSGTSLDIYSCSGQSNQQGSLQINSNGTATVIFENSGLCLDVPGASKTAVVLDQYTCNGSAAQQFTFAPVTGKTNTYTVMSVVSGLCLDVQNSTAGNGTPVQQYPCNGSAAQQWVPGGNSTAASASVLQQVLLSPEEAGSATIAAVNANLSTYDADGDGQLTMQDVAKLNGQGGTWQTIFVQPGASTDTSNGSGTLQSPFRLRNGNEYQLNAVARPYLDKGINTEIFFAAGTYSGVRLQILKEGIDTSAISIVDPTANPTVVNGLRSYAPIKYRITTNCNSSGQNCRVTDPYFIEGPNATSAKLVLRSVVGAAVFDGSYYQSTHRNIPAEAFLVGGSAFTSVATHNLVAQSQKLQNVLVSGFVFKNYINGLHVQYAQNIIIKNCQVLSTGSLLMQNQSIEALGVMGMTADSDAQVVLFKNNLIQNTWNSVDPTGPMASSPDSIAALAHAVYYGEAKDLIFLNNTLQNSSAILLKWGFYPLFTNGIISSVYPAGIANRRSFFVGNSFQQNLTYYGATTSTASSSAMGFVHDNSIETDNDGNMSTPAVGMSFLNNTFTLGNSALAGTANLVRLEIPSSSYVPTFSGWTLAGNKIQNVNSNQLLVDRVRAAAGFNNIVGSFPNFALPAQASSSAVELSASQLAAQVTSLLSPGGTVASTNTTRDALMTAVINSRGISGLDLP